MPSPKTLSFNSWLFCFSLFLTGLTSLLIFAGGLVTSHEAGLAVPDWPLSYGQLMPPMVGNVFWEHGHRMIAGTVGMLTLLLAIWTQFKEKRTWMKRLAWIAFGAVVLQALLGGLTVLLMLPPPVSIFHACLAQTFFCILISLAYFLSPAYFSLSSPNVFVGDPITNENVRQNSRRIRQSSRGGDSRLKHSGMTEKNEFASEAMKKIHRLARLTTVFIFIQLIFGATVRHTAHAVELHIAGAVLVVIHVILTVARVIYGEAQDKLLRRAALALGTLTLVQIFLGIGAFAFTRMIERGYAPSSAEVLFTALHQTAGALILGSAVFTTLRSRS